MSGLGEVPEWATPVDVAVYAILADPLDLAGEEPPEPVARFLWAQVALLGIEPGDETLEEGPGCPFLFYVDGLDRLASSVAALARGEHGELVAVDDPPGDPATLDAFDAVFGYNLTDPPEETP